MSEVKLTLKTDGYAPVSVNPDAFDVPNTGVEISKAIHEVHRSCRMTTTAL